MYLYLFSTALITDQIKLKLLYRQTIVAVIQSDDLQHCILNCFMTKTCDIKSLTGIFMSLPYKI